MKQKTQSQGQMFWPTDRSLPTTALGYAYLSGVSAHLFARLVSRTHPKAGLFCTCGLSVAN